MFSLVSVCLFRPPAGQATYAAGFLVNTFLDKKKISKQQKWCTCGIQSKHGFKRCRQSCSFYVIIWLWSCVHNISNAASMEGKHWQPLVTRSVDRRKMFIVQKKWGNHVCPQQVWQNFPLCFWYFTSPLLEMNVKYGVAIDQWALFFQALSLFLWTK